jgi:hypothetical protein
MERGKGLQSNYSDSETNLLKLTSSVQTRKTSESTTSLVYNIVGECVSRSKWRVHISSAGMSTASRRIRNVDKSSGESKIQEHANDTEESDASKTADEKEGENGVENTSAGNSFYRPNVRRDVEVMVMQCSQEIGEYAEDDCCAAEFYDSEEEGN